MNKKLAIVIATRNRSKELNTVLKSIEENTTHPNLISIVSSGDSIDEIIKLYSKFLMIVHEHSKKSGQVIQRKIALQKVLGSNDYILFLNDYTLIESNFIRETLESFSKLDDQTVGMGVIAINYSQEIPKLKALRKFLQNYSDKGGAVLKSGINLPYENLPKLSQTQWLNGTSVWRSFIFSEFEHTEMTGSYSAAEDLIFSYPIGKRFKLVTNPDLRVEYLTRQIKPRELINRSVSIILHRFYFVQQHSELSKFWFFINLQLSISLMILKFFYKPNLSNFFQVVGNLKSIFLFVKYVGLKLCKKIDSRWLINWN